MMSLVRACVKRPVFASVLMLVLVVVGVAAYARLGLEQLPNADVPIVVVTVALPGAAPAEVESEITDKIEGAVNTIGGIEELRSVSSEGFAQVIISFDLDKPLDAATQEVRDKVSATLPDLPAAAQTPVVSKLDLNSAPVLLLALRGQGDVGALTELADQEVRKSIESLLGVGQVSVIGGRKRQINVAFDPLAMRASGVTTADLERALAMQNLAAPGGPLEAGPARALVRVQGRVASADELRDFVVREHQGRPVRLGDVAEVEEGTDDEKSAALWDESPAVLIAVRKQSGQNTVVVVDAVKEQVNELRGRLPPGVTLDVITDGSLAIRAGVNSVTEHLLVGSLLAALVVLIFLGDVRSTAIAALAIPISIVGTFAVMWFQGFTLNILTLLALALAVGIVIDDAIVVLENIVRTIEHQGAKPFVASVVATQEIALAVIATTLSLLAVFLPVAFMGGIVGRFLKSFGLTMAFAIALSMLVSFSLTPSLCARFLRADAAEARGAVHRLVDAVYRPIERAYMKLLAASMRRRWVVVLCCALTLASIGPIAGSLPSSFVPPDDVSQFDVSVRAAGGLTVSEMRLTGERIAHRLRAVAGVEHTLLAIGGDAAQSPHLAKITVVLADPGRRPWTQSAVMARARAELASYETEGLRVTVGEAQVGGGDEATQTVQYSLRGPDVELLTELAEKVTTDLKRGARAVDVDTTARRPLPAWGVEIDRPRAADRGVSVADLSDTLRTFLAGKKVSTFAQAGKMYDVVLRAQAAYRREPDALLEMTVPSAEGAAVVGSVVNERAAKAPAEIRRLGRAREVTVLANPAPGEGDNAVAELLLASVAHHGLPDGYSVVPAGNSKELGKTQTAFAFAFGLAFAFMYLVLAAQFESWVHPVTILLTLPLTAAFGFLSLKMFGQGVNLFTALGLLVLFGVVKKNAILQIDHTRGLRAKGLPRDVAILQANRDRLRPILMTTIAFVAGMLPLLVSKGAGAGQSQSTAGIVVGGQTLSLLLTLVAVPVFYSLFDDLTEAVRRRFAKASADRGEAEFDALYGPAREKAAGARS
jgi:hydrophobic/amphiphilic exporter-1 (mainly G- bacteria), HAE1 family